jgi:hypothetical protein
MASKKIRTSKVYFRRSFWQSDFQPSDPFQIFRLSTYFFRLSTLWFLTFWPFPVKLVVLSTKLILFKIKYFNFNFRYFGSSVVLFVFFTHTFFTHTNTQTHKYSPSPRPHTVVIFSKFGIKLIFSKFKYFLLVNNSQNEKHIHLWVPFISNQIKWFITKFFI